MPKKVISFENAMERLEEIVNLLEGGESSLDQSLSLFEEGVKLVKICNEKLEKAEGAVKQLINVDGEFIESEFYEGDKND
ncbi:MAG: exodeoxyribonuclease VII small subunit [Clostridia bacterium]|nr:exodeoxyribonuclease VII small subunit [Clostridia bacterium]